MNLSSAQGSRPTEITAPADHLLMWLLPYANTQQGRESPAEKMAMSRSRSDNQTPSNLLVTKVAEDNPLDPAVGPDQHPRNPSVGKPDAGLEVMEEEKEKDTEKMKVIAENSGPPVSQDGNPTNPASTGTEPVLATNPGVIRKEPATSLANLDEEHEENDKV